MATEVEKIRPNIRVQIHNNVLENMDVDEEMKSENEEGEISDDNEPEVTHQKIVVENTSQSSNRIWPNPKGTFSTGINIFEKEEQEKLQERAKRFALKPEEIRNFTDEDLQELHDSLGITSENETNVRFEAIHLLGTDEMSTEDVFEYFQKYAPTGIEWVNDESCNVFWTDAISAARALHFVSKEVKGMPVRGPCDPFVKEFMDEDEDTEAGTGKSILLKNKDREIELKDDDDMDSGKKVENKDAVDVSDITVPIPPGYWRLGAKHPKSKCILLRFAFKTDKKPLKAEKFSNYYKKYGNPNFGGLKGIISESKKKEIRGIFDRNKELNNEKNPWGSLAKNWNNDVKFCEREPVIPEEPKIELKNPSLMGRLGTKRRRDSVTEEKEEAEIIEPEDDEEVEEKKKSKVPRMRMYADEEEEKQKRKKLLQTIRKQAEKISEGENLGCGDLRNILGLTNQKPVMVKQEVIQPETDPIDLGSKLKNRNKKMTYTVEREVDELENLPRKDIRAFLDERRARSPSRNARKSPVRLPQVPQRSPERRRRSPVRRRKSPPRNRQLPEKRRRLSPQRTLHSDRMYSTKSKPAAYDYSDDDEDELNSHKPKSKVAVVIKTQKKPTVASTVWSRKKRASDSESSSDSDSSESQEDSSSESGSKSEEDGNAMNVELEQRLERPGFRSDIKNRLSSKVDHRSPLKIEISNDHFKNN